MTMIERIWTRDPLLWSPDPARAPEIRNRLGWLSVFETMEPHLPGIRDFAVEVRKDRFRHAVILGMGGSSLCPDVLRSLFRSEHGLDLHVLDSTDPEAVRAVERAVDLDRTLFLVASKSGTTAEIVAFTDYFFGKRPNGSQFVAITDPGTALEKEAKAKNFRKTFLNPPDIGGRFSALSLFGLVPAALLGVDLPSYLAAAKRMAEACKRGTGNPGVELGTLIAEAAIAGRDKLTLLTSPNYALLGDWIEQLIGESTGKEGKGILPVTGEPLQGGYGNDRFIIAIRDRRTDCGEITAAGHPVMSIDLCDPIELGAEFFRWEFATAVAGAILKINPFDEPNVRQAKEATRRVLESFERSGSLERGPVISRLSKPLLRANPGDFVALLAFVPPTDEVRAEFQALRKAIGERYGVATTLGFGPRYLHSVGQYHKGGPNRGHFLFFTCDDKELAIPGRKYGFSVLKNAQAIGDMEALAAAKRHVLPFHVRGEFLTGLRKLRAEIQESLSA
jgi:glucose-6-phosphate isomerase